MVRQRKVKCGARSAPCTVLTLAVIALASLPAWAEDPTAPVERDERSLREAVRGRWQPMVLPPNDLSDPPKNYPRSPGGTCVGMSAVVYALWSSAVVDGHLTARDCAARIIDNMVPGPGGRMFNHPLPSHLLLPDGLVKLDDRRALVALAESIQNTLQPGGGRPKSPEKIPRMYAAVRRYPDRLDRADLLKRRVRQSGGRLVVGMLDFAADRRSMSGHAAIVTLGRDGKLYVWDPNAKMAADARGSGKLAPLKLHVDGAGRLAKVDYEITLPDDRPQRRQFSLVFPITVFITDNRLPRHGGGTDADEPALRLPGRQRRIDF